MSGSRSLLVIEEVNGELKFNIVDNPSKFQQRYIEKGNTKIRGIYELESSVELFDEFLNTANSDEDYSGKYLMISYNNSHLKIETVDGKKKTIAQLVSMEIENIAKNGLPACDSKKRYAIFKVTTGENMLSLKGVYNNTML